MKPNQVFTVIFSFFLCMCSGTAFGQLAIATSYKPTLTVRRPQIRRVKKEIDIAGVKKGTIISITNRAGMIFNTRTVEKDGPFHMKLHHLPAGIYLVKVRYPSGGIFEFFIEKP